MFINLICGLIGGAVLTLALATLGVADAGNEQRAQVIGDMNVYLGVMSAEAIRAQPALRIEEEMQVRFRRERMSTTSW
jgi:hypothetical protein